MKFYQPQFDFLLLCQTKIFFEVSFQKVEKKRKKETIDFMSTATIFGVKLAKGIVITPTVSSFEPFFI